MERYEGQGETRQAETSPAMRFCQCMIIVGKRGDK